MVTPMENLKYSMSFYENKGQILSLMTYDGEEVARGSAIIKDSKDRDYAYAQAYSYAAHQAFKNLQNRKAFAAVIAKEPETVNPFMSMNLKTQTVKKQFNVHFFNEDDAVMFSIKVEAESPREAKQKAVRMSEFSPEELAVMTLTAEEVRI